MRLRLQQTLLEISCFAYDLCDTRPFERRVDKNKIMGKLEDQVVRARVFICARMAPMPFSRCPLSTF